MQRKRHTPPTRSSVRELASRRGFLLTSDQRSARLYKLISFGDRVTPIPSNDNKHPYSWKLDHADSWLRRQPLLRDQSRK
jgi:hypothetical protein